MKDLSLGIKLGIGFGISLVLTLIIGGVSWYNFTEVSKKSRTLSFEFDPTRTLANTITSDAYRLWLAIRRYHTELSQEAWNGYLASKQELRTSLDKLKVHSQNYPHLQLTARMTTRGEALFASLEQSMEKVHAASTVQIESQQRLFELANTMITLLRDTILLDEGLTKAAIANGDLAQVEGYARVVSLNNGMLDDLNETRSLMWEALYRGDVALFDKVEKQFFPSIHEGLNELQTILREPQAKENMRKAAQALREYEASFKDLAASVVNRHSVREEYRKAMRLFISELQEGTQGIRSSNIRLIGEISDEAETSRGVVSVLVVLCVVLSLGTALLLTRAITVPMGKGVRFAESIAAGNLDDTLDVHGKDEIGKLADALRMMVQSLKAKIREANEQTANAAEKSEQALQAMKRAEEAQQYAEHAKREGMLTAAAQLEQVVDSVSSATEQLSAQIQESEQGASEQAMRVGETATAMEEMNSTVLEVARNAGQASEATSSTRKQAELGSQVVGRAVSSIQGVREQALKLKEDMEQLDNNAKAISQIMSVISDIADQTNLLALNAAIEAARAGDAGRGFAVVADEVRKLAEKTMLSTAEVGKSIAAIQQSASKSMAQVEASTRAIEEATGYVQQSGESLHMIVEEVDSAADQVQAIATAAEQQSATSDEINRSLGGVSLIADTNARSMQEASRAVHELASQSNILQKLIEEMKRG